MIALIAPSDAPAIIYGPTGAGKELVAEALHEESRRKGRFVTVNCAAIPKELIEAEIFGFEKGAFTGAIKTTQGKFEQAQKGTIFLDEIGDMPLETQVKVLRVLESGEFMRVGDSVTKKTDVRVIAATNKDLKKAIEDREFREDLYFRLNVFPLTTHALSERPDDILPIAAELLVRHQNEFEDFPTISEKALERLRDYSWPGNVRELENVIQRANVLRNSRLIEPQDIMIDEPVLDDRPEQSLVSHA